SMATSVEKNPIRLSRNIPESPVRCWRVGEALGRQAVAARWEGASVPKELRHASTMDLSATSSLYPRHCGRTRIRTAPHAGVVGVLNASTGAFQAAAEGVLAPSG